ncbi:Predicted protein [Taphrina deformans PYCC 5710]|uniref:Uncharacterized protein n=1 Tax=Taphrina deformans (strain PYCC 5710 / ATCC 11124 / CBS 356.35 / IMI 108563 / JCM 9778 / NBRC 8474) TaxID=1097556 RepID=R4X990_TAPDE|nr:Predicted protein [Taphrina deformans PYCC 5710]|eukprot:CCG82250.1 Predicted protein [Taphrina deformans PYCC 5710]
MPRGETATAKPPSTSKVTKPKSGYRTLDRKNPSKLKAGNHDESLEQATCHSDCSYSEQETNIGDLIGDIAERVRESHEEEIQLAEGRRRRLEMELCHAIEKTTGELNSSREIVVVSEGSAKSESLQHELNRSEDNFRDAKGAIERLRQELADLHQKMRHTTAHHEQAAGMLETQVSVLKAEKDALENLVQEHEKTLQASNVRQARLLSEFEREKDTLQSDLLQQAKVTEQAMTQRLKDLDADVEKANKQVAEEQRLAKQDSDNLQRQLLKLEADHQADLERLQTRLIEEQQESAKAAAYQESVCKELRKCLHSCRLERETHLKTVINRTEQAHQKLISKLQKDQREEIEKWKSRFLSERKKAEALVLTKSWIDHERQKSMAFRTIGVNTQGPTKSSSQNDRLKADLRAVDKANFALKEEAKNLIDRINAMRDHGAINQADPKPIAKSRRKDTRILDMRSSTE